MESTFKDELVGERITLKRTKPSIVFAQKMFKVIDENREHIKAWLPWEKYTLSPEDSLKYLFEKEIAVELGKKIEYGIYVQDEYIGNISVFDIHKTNKSAEVGYWFSKDHTGHGYMSEAVRIIEKEFFENQGLYRLELKCDELNKASSGVAIKCGYVLEGIHRGDSFIEEDNRFRNTLIFSKLKTEYSK